MAYRKTPIVQGEIYHVFNRSVGRQFIFLSTRDYQRALQVFRFYLYNKPSLRFSFYNRLPSDQKSNFFNEMIKSAFPIVDIICFCLMPNHFHFLLKNLTENGIKQFISNFQNSYAKYFNIKTDRTGTLFQQNFKAVRIESDEQLIHVSRYIHLNPVTSYIIEPEDIENYLWSSYLNYLKDESTYIFKDPVLGQFKSIEDYKKFVLNQVDYQRKLNEIKHLILE